MLFLLFVSGILPSCQDTRFRVENAFFINTPNPKATDTTLHQFYQTEHVYLIYDVRGMSREDDSIWVTEDLSIRGPDTKEIQNRKDILEVKKEIPTAAYVLRVYNKIGIGPMPAPGKYEVTLTVKDRFSGKEIKEELQFTILKGAPPTQIPRSK